MAGHEVVAAQAAHTPIGRRHGEGVFRGLRPNILLGKDYKAAMESASIEASEVDDVVSGCITQVGEQAINIARSTWLEASLLYRR